jgi:hypothetical protein
MLYVLKKTLEMGAEYFAITEINQAEGKIVKTLNWKTKKEILNSGITMLFLTPNINIVNYNKFEDFKTTPTDFEEVTTMPMKTFLKYNKFQDDIHYQSCRGFINHFLKMNDHNTEENINEALTRLRESTHKEYVTSLLNELDLNQLSLNLQ